MGNKCLMIFHYRNDILINEKLKNEKPKYKANIISSYEDDEFMNSLYMKNPLNTIPMKKKNIISISIDDFNLKKVHK